MSNVVIAIVTLVVTFLLASYGVFTNVEANRRTQLAMAVGSTLDREAGQIQDVAEELDRVPAIGDVDTTRLVRASGTATQYSYAVQDGVGYVCGRVSRTDAMSREAMDKVAADRPGAFVSGQCGVAGAAISNVISVSLRVR